MFDPCPPGYHVPDATVLSAVIGELPKDGYRLVNNDSIVEQLNKRGEEKHYWSASAYTHPTDGGSMNGVAYAKNNVSNIVKSFAMPIRAQKQ
jgi:hypothetical protein